MKRRKLLTIPMICLILMFLELQVFAQQETETAGASLGKEVEEISPDQISLCREGWELQPDGSWKYLDSDGSYANSAWRKIDGSWHWLNYDGIWVEDYKYRDYVEPALKGIDVSRWQGEIDWELVKRDGIQFAMIKIAGGSRSLDPKYKANISGANQVGIPVGVYFYSKAQSVEEAVLDAQFVIENMQGYTISYPVVIDVEDSSQQNLGKDKVGAIAKGFCDEIRAAGYTPMIYANENWYKNYIDMSQLTDVEKWIARYNYFYDTNISRNIWQCSSKGRVAGISGNVDINFGYTDYSQIITPRTAPNDSYSTKNGKWILDSIGWWYRYSNGSYPRNEWAYINGNWYWFDASGYMETGWTYISGNWYYLDANGVMLTGWLYVDGKWYYCDSSGKMLQNQWFGNYYLKSDGSMATGWTYRDGVYRYFDANGHIQTGWLYIDGYWYYMNANGIMATGWAYINGNWYYLNASGEMVTDWVFIDGNWYYFSASGIMETGWLYINGVWYYLRENGSMAVGVVEIEGRSRFNPSGVWLGYC